MKPKNLMLALLCLSRALTSFSLIFFFLLFRIGIFMLYKLSFWFSQGFTKSFSCVSKGAFGLEHLRNAGNVDTLGTL
jgi:hypothetical protein